MPRSWLFPLASLYHRHEARHLSNSPPVGLLVDDIDVFDFASGEHTATAKA